MKILLLIISAFHLVVSCHGFIATTTTRRHYANRRMTLQMSLKPAAIPLMDAGKALARSGELLVDSTNKEPLNNYGGGLSAAGAMIRNAGDCIAQAAASCRFKTGTELVTDELREAATCLEEATSKLRLAVEEANADEDEKLALTIESAVTPARNAHFALEAAGAGIMQRLPLSEIGGKLVECGDNFELLSQRLEPIAPECSGRMVFGSEKMKEAGNNLAGVQKEKPKGKAWLKA
mmetsp:Transcript_5120/g.9402  ORF Transcript_5120/g.9402 Transcript_5120/m.9402 type:complete len:235 (+) Transcript_5120:90-794(+)